MVDDVEAFLKAHDMSPVTFGRKAMNDPHFVRDIRADPPRRLFRETEEKVRAFIAEYAPEDRSEAA